MLPVADNEQLYVMTERYGKQFEYWIYLYIRISCNRLQNVVKCLYTACKCLYGTRIFFFFLNLQFYLCKTSPVPKVILSKINIIPKYLLVKSKNLPYRDLSLSYRYIYTRITVKSKFMETRPMCTVCTTRCRH